MVSRNHWIGVVSRAQVQIGVKGGSIQLNHGKKAPLEKLRAGDALVMYSPRTEYPDGKLLQALHWGAAFRFGQLKIPASDFALIAEEMGCARLVENAL